MLEANKMDPAWGWNDERTAEAVRLWNDGHSATAVAAEIGGVSRNAVIGKVTRLGLARRETVSFVRTSEGLRRSSTPAPKRGPGVSPSLKFRSPALFKKLAIPPPVAALEHKVSFFNLEQQHCRFPLWDGDVSLSERFYCGAPKALVPENGPYCGWHHKHTHNGFPPRK